MFFDGVGKFYRDRIREAINGEHHFKAIYIIGLLNVDKDGYTYVLTQFHPKTPNTSTSYEVHIDDDFTHWTVKSI